MSERRKSPRTQCRLGCLIHRGRERIRARVLDISESGFCVLSAEELVKGQSLVVVIDVPNHGPAKVRADVWHVRRSKSPSSGKKIWSAGMLLVKSDDTYERLFAPTIFDSCEQEDVPQDEPDDLKVFRVRVQLRGEPRSRLLTLAAGTRQEAGQLALADLDHSWTITEISSVPAEK